MSEQNVETVKRGSGSRRFLFVSWDGGGNFVPALGIAGALAARGHQVTFVGQRSLAARVEARGFAFHPFDRLPEWTAGRSIEEEAPAFVGLLSGPETAEALTGALELARPDGMIVDCMLAGALAAAEGSEVPSAALVHVLDHSSPEGILARSFSGMMPAVNDTRSGLGLGPAASYADLLEPMERVLVTSVEALDVPSSRPRSENVRYIGPVLDTKPETSAAKAATDEGPLVLVSFSTTYQHQEEPLQRVADALGELPLHGVMTLGDVLAPEALSMPANVTARAFAPHADLLPRASLVITHAGLGTVMAALGHGVPLVCLPMGRDQDTNARRAESLGTGLRLPVDAPVAEIRRAVEEVLRTPSYREAAQRVQQTFSSARGAVGAAEELERMCARGSTL